MSALTLTTRAVRWAAPLGIAAVVLTGCTGQVEPEAAPSPAVPTPTQISQPDDEQACTVDLETTGGAGHPDRATIVCGDSAREVAGDFRHQVTNRYDMAATGGIEQIIVVGDERRVWMNHPDGGCLITWSEGNDPTACKPSANGSAADDQDDEPLSREGLAEQDA